MNWKTLFVLIIPFALGAYQPGTPGAPWTPEQASIIRAKILKLWIKPKTWTKLVDPLVGSQSQYLYYPYNMTFTPDYEKCVTVEDCDNGFFIGRIQKFAFDKRKALRLRIV